MENLKNVKNYYFDQWNVIAEQKSQYSVTYHHWGVALAKLVGRSAFKTKVVGSNPTSVKDPRVIRIKKRC